ncbi:LOW QUALITY PROTEIN: WD repeat-containing protein 97 [Callospermophilus lateralis]
MLDTSKPLSSEGDNLLLDSDLYDVDGFDNPDPGLLSEKNGEGDWPYPLGTWPETGLIWTWFWEHNSGQVGAQDLCCLEQSQVLQLFTSTQRWQNMPLCTRAHQLWLLIRTGLHNVVEKEKRAELRVARLTHGLEPLRRLEVPAGLRSVAQDPVGGRFVVLDGAGCLHLHKKDGWAQETLLAPVALTGLVAVLGPLGAVGRFVGWGPTGLAILRPDLSLLWLSQPEVGRVLGREPTCCLPVPNLGLLLVAEVGGSLALFKFRSGGRRLVLRGLPLQPPPGLVGTLKRLALGPGSTHQDTHCFAAYGSAVLTFNLQAWNLTDVRQNLHKTTISDLAYFEEAKAMVTSSQDSTVKVWEVNWQIRMVFVGHTGPVTAMVILPNTTRVSSASQDGTLRTWDLQAAAQVGEVALCSWGQDVLSARVSRLLAPAARGWPVLSLCASSVELWRLSELYSPLAQLPAPVLHLQVAPALPAPVNPSLPARLVCACVDGSVYLVSAATGRTVSALLLEAEDCAVAVAYCLPREALWLLTRTGHLVRANAACCPMSVLHRVCPPPPPAPQPCCLHLYSHLTDPGSALACWEIVRQNEGDLRRSAMAWAWKNKNRYLPVIGHTDGALSVLDWLSSKTVFHTEAHSPGPVTAIASTWNSIVSSGGDLTVKMWRVFPYAEESLSLLRTFSCCHPVVVLCALGKRITVGFEDPNTATYGLVQFGLGEGRRCDHRPQDDPMDHITGLCCCPTLKLYACSSLDCTIRIWTSENRLLRLLQLDGSPQALAFSSNSGDLVLAMGSRLCLVSHRLYLPTAYLVKNLCQKAPDVVDDPPLPLTSHESLTSIQMQRLTNLQGAFSLSPALLSTRRQTAAPQQLVMKEDLEAIMARDQDLQELRLGQVIPAARPPPSWKQRQEAFDNYLRLIYGPGLLDMQFKREPQQGSIMTLTTERELQDKTCVPCPELPPALDRLPSAVRPTVPKALLHPQTPGAPGQHFAPPQVILPIPHHQKVHSKVSKLLACSSLSCDLGLSLDLQMQLEQLREEMTVALDPPSSLPPQVPLWLQKQPKDPLSNLKGFFPATVQSHKYCPRPISFPGCVPNSVVLQQMWPSTEISYLRPLTTLTSYTENRLKPDASLDDLWLQRHRWSKWHSRLMQWLHGKSEEEEEEEEEEEKELKIDWISASLSSPRMYSDQQLDYWEAEAGSAMDLIGESQSFHEAPRTKTYFGSQYHQGHSLWEERYGHLPRFLHSFVIQNWFKKLFPIFTLEAYPEMGTVEGLASMLVDLLAEATWEDRVHILNALLRLLPDVSSDLHSRLQSNLLHLLNLDNPPSLQDHIQKQFVMLALQLLLACSLDSRDVVLELMSYFLYSPASDRPELKKLLNGLGLRDPEGFLFKEMTTWVRGSKLNSKAKLRLHCCQKLEGMIQQLKMETLQPSTAQLSVVLPKGSGTWPPSFPPREDQSQASAVSGAPSSVFWPQASQALLHVLEPPLLVVSPTESKAGAPEPQAHFCTGQTRRSLSETLKSFCSVPEPSMPTAPHGLPQPLEKTDWSHWQMLDLGYIDALNYFCEQHQVQQQSLIQKETEQPPCSASPRPPVPNTVVAPPRDQGHYPILRLQEAKARSSGMRMKGPVMSHLSTHCARSLDRSIRVLKLPLPRVELQPFPPGWPAPPRALPPLLLQPTLQRYFLPQDADPDSYS